MCFLSARGEANETKKEIKKKKKSSAVSPNPAGWCQNTLLYGKEASWPADISERGLQHLDAAHSWWHFKDVCSAGHWLPMQRPWGEDTSALPALVYVGGHINDEGLCTLHLPPRMQLRHQTHLPHKDEPQGTFQKNRMGLEVASQTHSHHHGHDTRLLSGNFNTHRHVKMNYTKDARVNPLWAQRRRLHPHQ